MGTIEMRLCGRREQLPHPLIRSLPLKMKTLNLLVFKSLLEILAAPIQQCVRTETYGLCSTNSLGAQSKAQCKFSFLKLTPPSETKEFKGH